ncbi:nucleoid occlusion protein [Anaerobranca gottschalkii]|uniref:Chromosome partitioning protein, ParB family n=1 Tax=Anaerobranca gottschalkii DSM 13577 TaxID=1120990 RepID=A0A1I0B379_9FIRM|nr:nucleoid occlusion protein [Anaerobranca gottschalkii]SET01180.1 chromosome partitioning protein, ParB family [Anaerobranca gottschalkii DSM 13577]
MREQLSKLLGQLEKGEEIQQIPINKITSNPFQPRKHFDDEKIDELAQSIKTYGLLQPIILRKVDDKYEIIAGERRFKACVKLGFNKVSAIVKEANDGAMAAIALIENIQRENLNFLEEAEGLHRLITEFNLTQEVLAQRIGKSQSTIANKLRLLKLPQEVKEQLKNSNLTERHARALLKLPEHEQLPLLKRIIDEGMTVRQTEEAVEILVQTGVTEEKSNDETSKAQTRRFVIKDFRIFLNSIKQVVSTIKSTGIDAIMEEDDNEDYLEVRIRLPKNR